MFSVITPCYNSERYLKSCIDSVQHQTLKNWEHILIDDCSSDNTRKICEEARNSDNRIRVITLTKNGGAAVARNVGIKTAKGRYIAFLDSDDLWGPEKLEKQFEALQKSGAALCYSWYEMIDANGKSMGTVKSPECVSKKNFEVGNPIGCLTAIYDREKVGTVLMPDLRMRQDWGLWIRVLSLCGQSIGIQESLASLRVHSKSMTKNKLRAIYYTWMVLRTEARLGVVASGLGVIRHINTAIIRRFLRS